MDIVKIHVPAALKDHQRVKREQRGRLQPGGLVLPKDRHKNRVEKVQMV